MGTDTVAIIGGGLAGAKAAETLRAEGFSGRVALIGAEPDVPYERPPLSKDYLLGDTGRSGLAVHDEAWYAEHDVELFLGNAAIAIHRDTRTVELAGGIRVPYSRLLLATGASPRRLSLPGIELEGIHYLREVHDSDSVREALRARAPVAVVGGGWIGLEVAAAARRYGCAVTVIEPQDVPLRTTLGPRIGEYFAALHRRHGVRLLTGQRPTGLIGPGRVIGVTTDAHEEVEAEVVVIGVGARPNTVLARGSGLAVDDGVVVDEHLRTADPAVYAAGDVASAYHPWYGRHVRVEHWANALVQGPAAARSLLGDERPFDEIPFFFTDQYDVGMEFAGLVEPGRQHTVITRGDVDGDAFHAFWLADDRVVAGMHVNSWDDGIGPAQRLISGRSRIDPARLSDTSVPLTDVASEADALAEPQVFR